MRLLFVIECIAAVSFPLSSQAQDYTYEVTGEGDNGSVSGTVDAWNGQRDVEGTIIDENGDEKSFEGEWSGNGEIEGYDEDGNYLELETE
jgi:hypothetical protein